MRHSLDVRPQAHHVTATGALIPYMEIHYHIGFAVMSLIFVGQAVGFILAAFFNNYLLNKLRRAKVLMLAELIMIGGYIILVCTPPYAGVVVAYVLAHSHPTPYHLD